MKANNLPSQEELLEMFYYEPETGKLFRRPKKIKNIGDKSWNARFANKEVGSISEFRYKQSGYVARYLQVKLKIDGIYRSFLVHRIIWKLVHGVSPDIIDHLNGDSLDNRLCNLRNVSRSENQRNSKMRSNNTSGFTGVSWNSNEEKYRATVKTTDGSIFLGAFDCPAEAYQVRIDYLKEHPDLGYTERHGQEAEA